MVARSVRDTAAILDAVHGPAPGDPYVAPPPERPYIEEVGADPGKLRIGLITEPVRRPARSTRTCSRGRARRRRAARGARPHGRRADTRRRLRRDRRP